MIKGIKEMLSWKNQGQVGSERENLAAVERLEGIPALPKKRSAIEVDEMDEKVGLQGKPMKEQMEGMDMQEKVKLARQVPLIHGINQKKGITDSVDIEEFPYDEKEELEVDERMVGWQEHEDEEEQVYGELDDFEESDVDESIEEDPFDDRVKNESPYTKVRVVYSLRKNDSSHSNTLSHIEREFLFNLPKSQFEKVWLDEIFSVGYFSGKEINGATVIINPKEACTVEIL